MDWHFAMMNDFPRNDAYNGALKLAIAEQRAAGNGDPFVLDIGNCSCGDHMGYPPKRWP